LNDILGFIHIGNLGRGKEIFLDQMDLIKSSGLYSKTKCIHIGVAGKALDFCFIDPKITIASHDPVLTNGECLLLKTMHEYCQTCEPAKIWYIHTKGARFSNPNEKIYHNENAWREYMQYFIIENHENCIKTLDEFDVCGVEWCCVYRNFGGNFWWANSDYIKKIKNPMTAKKNDRHKTAQDDRCLAEVDFIGKENPKFKSFYYFGKSMYINKIPKIAYLKIEMI
jgi:hypothetical protein